MLSAPYCAPSRRESSIGGTGKLTQGDGLALHKDSWIVLKRVAKHNFELFAAEVSTSNFQFLYGIE